MTQHKHLKALIRARAQRTGESYTTARRQVLGAPGVGAGAEADPGRLVPGYPPTGGGAHHDSALVAHLLSASGHRAPHTGQPWSEAMLAGLAGGIGFMYALYSYRGHPPMLTLVCRHHPDPFVEAALSRSGTVVESRTRSSEALAGTDLAEVLGSGRPALVTVARGALPWHGIVGEAAGEPYDVVVAGLDVEAGRAWVDDEAVMPRAIDLSDLAGARAAHRKSRHRLLAVTGADPDHDLATSVREAVRATHHHLTQPVLGNAFDVNFGLSGMSRLAKDVADTRTAQGWWKRSRHPLALFHLLRRLHDCVEIELTAPGAMRPLYADFLTEAAPVLGGDHGRHLVEAAALYRRSGQEWAALAEAALPQSVPTLHAYADLVEQRLHLLATGAPADDVRAVTAQVDLLGLAHAEADPLDDDDRADLLVDLSRQVTAITHLETDAAAELAHLR